MVVDQFGEALKGAVDLSVRYYAGLLKLSTDYVQSLGSLISTAGSLSSEPAARRSAPAGSVAVPPRPPLLLAARAGEDAVAAFLIDNMMNERVTARIVVHGAGMAAHATVQPEVVSLGPGEQCVVQLRTRVDGGTEPGRDHVGEIAVPELASRTIPFVVRRLPDDATQTATDNRATSG
jgi:hypothetical protein